MPLGPLLLPLFRLRIISSKSELDSLKCSAVFSDSWSFFFSFETISFSSRFDFVCSVKIFWYAFLMSFSGQVMSCLIRSGYLIDL